MSEMLKTIEDVKRAFPTYFEYCETLARDIEHLTAEYGEAKERRAQRGVDYSLERSHYDAYHQRLTLMRRELEGVAKKIAGIVATLPPQPIVIPSP